MSLWGKTDALASKPKYLTKKNAFDASSASVVNTTDDTITMVGHGFQTGDAVLYTSAGTPPTGVSSATTYYIIRVDSDTVKLAADANDATAGTAVDITAVGDQTADTLQLTAPTVFFVDAQEALAVENKQKGITGSGWWLYRSYTDAQANTRHRAECLVAMGVDPTVSGDAEDAVMVDLAIVISSQPIDATVTEPATATFTVVASVNSANPLSYQWEKQEGGAGLWAEIVGATSASFTTPATVAADDDGDKYRVVISSDGATSVTSSEVTLTVTV